MIIRGRNIVLLVIILLAGTLRVPAQNSSKFRQRVDSLLIRKYWRANVDTSYVTRPQAKMMILGRLNVSGAKIKTQGHINNHSFSSELTADYKSTLSAGVSYRGILINFSVNPARLLGKYRDFELYLQSYKPRFGFDISYQDAHNFKGTVTVDDVQNHVTKTDDMFKVETVHINMYYVFNPRRFSYAAALAYSYIQRKSAGSLLIAVSAQGQHARVQSSESGVIDFKMTIIGIGAGYGYNYVPSPSWLFHLSTVPTFIVYSKTSFTSDNDNVPLQYRFPEFIVTSRAAIVKQIGKNKFAGLSMVYYYTNIGEEKHLYVNNRKWLVRIYFGFRL